MVTLTNISAMRSSEGMANSNAAMKTAMERLSTGSRINSASDDAAGMAIAQRMSSQILEMGQAINNAGDGISLLNTADAALDEVETMLQRIRELAIQKENGTASAADKVFLQNEIDALKTEIGRIGANTEFNGTKLFDGSIKDIVVASNGDKTVSAQFDKVSYSALAGTGDWSFQGTVDTEAGYPFGLTDDNRLVYPDGRNLSGGTKYKVLRNGSFSDFSATTGQLTQDGHNPKSVGRTKVSPEGRFVVRVANSQMDEWWLQIDDHITGTPVSSFFRDQGLNFEVNFVREDLIEIDGGMHVYTDITHYSAKHLFQYNGSSWVEITPTVEGSTSRYNSQKWFFSDDMNYAVASGDFSDRDGTRTDLSFYEFNGSEWILTKSITPPLSESGSFLMGVDGNLETALLSVGSEGESKFGLFSLVDGTWIT